MPKIFISYRRRDSNAIAGRLADNLRREFGNDNVFKDDRTIPPGIDFRGYIREGIGKCDVMLVVVGKTWLTVTEEGSDTRRLDNPDDWVRLEVLTGLQRHGLFVTPLLVDNATMPTAEQLPDVIREFAFRNARSLRNDPNYRHDLADLITWLKAVDSGDVAKVFPDEIKMPSAELAKKQADHALAAARRPAKPETKTKRRVIGDIPYVYNDSNPFVDRVQEQADIGAAIDQRRRVIVISGRAGVGKTGLVSKILGDLRYATDKIDGVVVQRAGNALREVSLDNVLNDFARLLENESLTKLDPKMSDEAKALTLLRATSQGRYVLLLDNFESIQDDKTHIITQSDVKALVEQVLEHGGLTIIITTRVPLNLDALLAAEVDHYELRKGLPESDAIVYMRERPGG